METIGALDPTLSGRTWQPGGKKVLSEVLSQCFKLFKWHPMNAIHRTGVDGLLDAFSGVTVLANGTGSTVPGFNNKCVSCHMGAISTTNTCGFIDPDGLFPKGSTEQRFTTRRPSSGWVN